MSADPLQPPERSAWRNPYGIALVGYYLVMAVVGMLVPDDILQRNAWARGFSDFMASSVPQIDRITALNIKPDVNRFYFSILWAGSPVLSVISLLFIWDGWRRRSALIWTAPLKAALLPMGFALVVTIAMLQVDWLVEPTLRLAKTYFGTVFGRAAIAQVFVLGPVLFGLGLPFGCWAGSVATSLATSRSNTTAKQQRLMRTSKLRTYWFKPLDI